MSSLKLKNNVVTSRWLAEKLHHPELVLLDASWHMPGSGRDGLTEFVEQHIATAQFFDFDGDVVAASSLPHMLPDEAQFQQAARRFGINNDSAIVVYDSHGLFSAARVWWMFKAMGHNKVAVLNGGLPAWLAQEGELAAGTPNARPQGQFVAKLQPTLVVDKREVQLSLHAPERVILDARGPQRFSGAAADPRPTVAAGHMPGAINLPYASLIDDGKLLPPFLLHQRFVERGVDGNARQIYSCGSGVTACILALAATEIGVQNWGVYDGSWVEWGAASDTEKVID
ncbi:rhodanese-like domain-containing protein [uncultured Ferrimonas sp.]|uniref:sulfurtransferase n=1 Tax=uncultured Ferrimonas sp. TaxID=432640 RepID=UPI00260B1B48|nr:rhodanese-like domain-containing protein [uncultured Ferrimonas sp.]